MTKKLLLLLTILILTFSLTACGNSANKKAAEDIDVKITALGDVTTLTLDKENDVLEVRRAYNSLTSEQKKLVTKLEALAAVERQIELLKADKSAVEDIDARISALGNINDNIPTKTRIIRSIRREYDYLTSEQKNLVTKLDLLVSAETKIPELQAEADRVAEQAAGQKAAAEQAAAEKALADQSANIASIETENQEYANRLKQYMYTGFGDPEYTETSWYDNIKDIIVKNSGFEKYAEIKVDTVLSSMQMNATMGAVLYNDVVPLKKVQLINSKTGGIIDETSK